MDGAEHFIEEAYKSEAAAGPYGVRAELDRAL
jgi:hypothetical protein